MTALVARRARPSAPDDDALVRRAGRRAAALSALLVAGSFVLCAGLVVLVVVTGQHRDADRALRTAATAADDVSDPPDGVWLLLRRPDGSTLLSPGAPPALPDPAGLAAVSRSGSAPVLVHDVHTAEGEFRVRTQQKATPEGPEVVQAALALAAQHAELRRLLAALGAAGALALLAAGGLGVVSGRRTVRGLVDTLARQRRFVADASHELRTPLTVLDTRAQLLRRSLRGDLDADARRSVAAAADALVADTARLAEVVEDLLAATEPSPQDGQPVDLVPVAADAVAAMRPLADGRGVRLDLCPPGAASPVLVRAEHAALRRSLVALLDNAVRHSPAGGTVTVTVAGGRTGGTVTVRDGGPGVPAELQDRLFDRFAHGQRPPPDGQADGERRRYGLGLALVADTAHRFGGSVRVDASAAGSSFTVSLPGVR